MTNSSSTCFFILVSFVGLLGMLITIINFDLIVATPLGRSILDNIMFRGCLVMISYMEMLVYLVLIDLQDFNVILGMDWLVSYYVYVDCFKKMVTFHIFS